MKHFCCFLVLLLLIGLVAPLCEKPPEKASFKNLWFKVTKLQNEQKYAAALKTVEQIYLKAVKEKDQQQWTKSLIRVVLLKRGLHSNEKAVRFLLEKKWPTDSQQKALVHLFFANTLYDYYRHYAWEINQREKVVSKRGVDLKKWTAFDIFAEANKQYANAYKYKDLMGLLFVRDFPNYVRRNGYPKNIRATMRDFMVYQWANFLSNTTTWRPEQLKEKHKLNLSLLLVAPEKRKIVGPEFFLNKQTHPLLKAVHILDDLYRWHIRNDRAQSALESQLERYRRVATIFNNKEKKDSIIASLKKFLEKFSCYPWWAVGQHQLAELVRSKGQLVAAHKIAINGHKRYPNSLGGKKCLYLARSIEAPYFSLTTMTLDKLGARSIQISHKNINKLYLRAYKVDFDRWLNRKYRYFGGIYSNELRDVIKNQTPVATWQVDLPNPGDYKTHKTYSIPKLNLKGLYMIAASARQDFKMAERSFFRKKYYRNQINGTYMLFSDLVTVLKPASKNSENGWEAFVVNGNTGNPVAGATVKLYHSDYNRGSQFKEQQISGADGRVLFSYKTRMWSCFIVAHKGNDFSFDPNSIYFQRNYRRRRTRQGCFIYTDRSIYRPLQKLYFKVVTYRGRAGSGEYRCIPGRTANIRFSDPNGKQIAEIKVKTNAYGTAAGEFTIPKGRILGRYNLRCTVDGAYGYGNVQVEEYKRPTFEVTLKKPEESLKLNQNVAIQGNARYYFGLPVSNGKIFYRVTRVPVWPWWYWWYYGNQDRSRYTYEVASGKTLLKPDGTFDIPFVPQADPSMSKQKYISYHFKVDVEITDEGGETRTGSRSYPIGFVAVRAAYSFPYSYYLGKENVSLTIRRTDLSGVARAGEGNYRLVRIEQPAKVVTPSQLPIKIAAGQKYSNGDTQRPRWEGDKGLQQFLFNFKDGELVKAGVLQHGQNGVAELDFGKLATGAYRLHYTTKDEWGGQYESRRDFLVAGPNMKLAVPFLLLARKTHLRVGEDALFFFGSGVKKQSYWLEFFQAGKIFKRTLLNVGDKKQILEIPILAKHRGGFSMRIFGVHDYKIYNKSINIFVPWDNKHLKVKFKTFRNLLRPGQKETWTVSVKGPKSELVAAELLAYMYDRSLDSFVPHRYPHLDQLFPRTYGVGSLRSNLSTRGFSSIYSHQLYILPSNPSFREDYFIVFNGYPVGGLGRRRLYSHRRRFSKSMVAEKMADEAKPTSAPAPGKPQMARMKAKNGGGRMEKKQAEKAPQQAKKEVKLRSNFSETAFFKPHLLVDKKGEAKIEFHVPDSVTSWNVYVHGITKDIRFMTLKKNTATRKDMMVRPYVPRFFREGDEAVLKVVINNATDKLMKGDVTLAIIDPQTKKDKTSLFAIDKLRMTWQAKGKRSANVSWKLKAPHKLGIYAFKVVARSENYSDGELRPLPVLPSRIHLIQSKFVTLKGNDSRVLFIKDMEKADLDPTLINQQLVVNINAQLIYTVLKSLPYLVNYPYECVEQTLNRFLSTSIVSSLYNQYPAIAKMAKKFSQRKTRLDPWRKQDANRKMALEETPWLVTAEGGRKDMRNLINVLDANIAKAHRDSALTKLRKAQLGNGAFPWWPGGPASPYMTLYIVHGFAKAQEFKASIPKDMVQRAWKYLGQYFRDYFEQRMIKEHYGYSFITFLNYVLSCYRDSSYYSGGFSQKQRREMLDFSFKYWKKHSPYLKAYLALTLVRMDRPQQARLVLESIMDSAITKQDQGTFWAPEDRGWLWYNDNIESHAFVLRALQEIKPQDKKHIDGLVLWLLLNKKLGQWKSTRATAEVIYSLVYTMHKQKSLAVRETADVTIGPKVHKFVFEPDVYSGGQTQIVLRGEKIKPKAMARVQVKKTGPGYMFASMNWHYSTEKLPAEARGDFLAVTRRYYLREHRGKEYILRPLADGTPINIGDQVEVHLSIRSKHPMEYVHLRDPRGAGFEPMKNVSGHHWEFGIYWYQEVRDSGTNFFFENLPQGEYNFRYRVRATMAGKFRVGPATIQSMYAPEFTAFSRGMVLKIR